jgi:pyruvate kinase
MIQKLTKIIATMGPNLGQEQIAELIEAGVDVFRFNYKHHDFEWHKERMGWVRHASDQANRFVGILLDLQGPEIRLTLAEPTYSIRVGDWMKLSDTLDGSFSPLAQVSHPDILSHLHEGDTVYVSGGAFAFTVTHREGDVFLVSQSEGVLKSRQSMTAPDHPATIPTLSTHDNEGMSLAKEMEVDYIALSFVRTESDIKSLKQAIARENLDLKVIAKIETVSAMERLKAVVGASDGVMVARGDLAVAAPLAQVPFFQKQIIAQAVLQNKMVITATEMLESMITKPHPTRAEISDVANAAYDRTDAVMLSAETAIGAYPVQTVATMRDILAFNEQQTPADSRLNYQVKLNDAEATVAEAAYDLSIKLQSHRKVTAFLCFTRSGYTATVLSQFRAHIPVIAFCPSPTIARRLSIRFGVRAVVNTDIYPVEPAVSPEKVLQAVHHASHLGLVRPGETLIVLHENAWGFEPGTSSIKLVRVPE